MLRHSILCLCLLSVLSSPPFLLIDSSSNTQSIWTHHINAWGAEDLDGLLSDYTEDSFLIINNKVFSGVAEIKNVFHQLFNLFSWGENKIDPATIKDRTIYITWNFSLKGKSFVGTDSFFLENGKIQVQTIASPLYLDYPITHLGEDNKEE